MKIILKRISCIVLMIMLFSCVINTGFVNICHGSGFGDKMLSEMDTIESKGDSTDATTKVGDVLSVIITIVRIAGVCIAITMLLAVAMKYMTAAAGEKADIKKSAVQYVVGAIVLFGVVGILGIINEFAKNIDTGK